MNSTKLFTVQGWQRLVILLKQLPAACSYAIHR